MIIRTHGFGRYNGKIGSAKKQEEKLISQPKEIKVEKIKPAVPPVAKARKQATKTSVSAKNEKETDEIAELVSRIEKRESETILG